MTETFARMIADVTSEPWAHTIPGSDPRFTDAVRWHGQPGVSLQFRRRYRMWSNRRLGRDRMRIQPDNRGLKGTLLAEIGEAGTLSTPEARMVRHRELASAIEAFRSEVDRVSGLPLEDALMDYFAAATAWDEFRLSSIRKHLGLNAEGPCSYAKAGASIRVSPERIRQHMEKLKHWLSDIPGPAFMPQLDEAARTLESSMPLGLEAATKLLSEKGIAAGPVHPAGFVRAAALCGRALDISTKTVVGGHAVGSAGSMAKVEQVVGVCLRQAIENGAVSIGEVVEDLSASGVAVTPAAVGRCLRADSRAAFLANEWFWFPDSPANRIQVLAHRMLAAHEPQTVMCLRAGLHRAFCYRRNCGRNSWPCYVSPPLILLEFFRQHPGFRLGARDLVYSAGGPDPESVMTSTERRIVDAIKGFSDRFPKRHELCDTLTAAGVDSSTLATAFKSSAVVERLWKGMWTTRGIGHAGGDDGKTGRRRPRPNPRRTIGYSWLGGGRLAVAFRLPGFTTDPAISIPPPVLDNLAGRKFAAFDEDDRDMGVVRVDPRDGGYSLGYGRFLNSGGDGEGAMAREGDILIAKFNLDNDTVSLKVKFLDIADYDPDDLPDNDHAKG